MRETPKASQAFADYLAMGEGRSLEKLAAQYQGDPKVPPTRRYKTLRKWSALLHWQNRLIEIAEQQRQAIIARGIIEKQNRLDAYNDLFNRSYQVIKARADDISMQGAGSDTGLLVRTYKATKLEVYEEYAVDTALIREMRELAKQTAQEMGQWTEKQEVTGKDGGPIRLVRELSDDDLLRIASGSGPGAI
jgi:hypothetical protein